MSEKQVSVRLIVKVPATARVAEYEWTDATRFSTFDIEVPDELRTLLLKNDEATVVGADIRVREGSK